MNSKAKKKLHKGIKAFSANDIASLKIQTITGKLKGREVKKALAHEHMFTDFHPVTCNRYMSVNWSNKIGAAVESALVLDSQGVNLVVEWTNIGVGRNVLALRSVSQQSGINFVCPTGVYKDFLPPSLVGLSSRSLADHFISELTSGIDGTAIRAGFIKTSATEDGIKKTEVPVLKAAAIAAKETGSTIGFHGPIASTTFSATAIMEKMGFDLKRFVWAHAQVSSLNDNIALARRGVMLQYDAIGAHTDQFFGGPVGDDLMLQRLDEMILAGFEDQILLSTDACACINPPGAQYDRHNSYLYRFFEDKMNNRIGKKTTRKILRNNVIAAFRCPSKVN